MTQRRALFFLGILAVHLPGSATDVTMTLKGQLTIAACNVVSSDTTKTVKLDTIIAQQFPTAGLTGPTRSFTIGLENCRDVSQITAALSGTADSSDSTLLALNRSGSPAGNLAIQILDDRDNPVALGHEITVPTSMSSSEAQLTFKLRYKSTGAVSAGAANSVLYVDFSYQ